MTAPPDHPSEPPPSVTFIEAGRRRSLFDFSELWEYREVVYFLVWRDFKVKYRQTFLGIFWAVAQPLVSMGIFTFVFGTLIGVPTDGVPYAIFALSGLVPWNFFARAVPLMTGCLTGNQEMVRRVYFPRIAIPLSTMLTVGADLALGLLLLAIFMGALHMAPRVQLFLLPLLMLQLLAATFGIGLFLSASNVRFRDVAYVVPFAVQTLLFLTPVVYPSSLLPAPLRALAGLNPMAGVIEGFRWCLFGIPPSWSAIAVSLFMTVTVLVAGLAWFTRYERSFADVI